jgi:hypothetical protein
VRAEGYCRTTGPSLAGGKSFLLLRWLRATSLASGKNSQYRCPTAPRCHVGLLRHLTLMGETLHNRLMDAPMVREAPAAWLGKPPAA